ncbi:DUF4929 family protein [uncultured Porphyromonas sp.]|uniref:DUF4929 family protein n=1 Tax=uncultured Porphyromonas sp. TaxID=159274 RepID=UPI00261BCD04|nr:DUF4929 family protein [uncultured Porphyromonas sp.]
MTRPITTVLYTLLALLALGLTSCRKDSPTPNRYTGQDKVYLSLSDGTRSGTISSLETRPIRVLIRLTRPVEQPLTLSFSLEGSAAPSLSLSSQIVTIPAGSFEGELSITPHFKTLTESLEATLRVTSPLPSDGDLTLRVTPIRSWSPTPEQEKLIAGYKAKGIDLSRVLGFHSVSGTVDFAGFGEYDYGPTDAPLKEERMSLSSEIMRVELSRHATADRPILTFSYNAFGLNAILKRIWYALSINNDFEFRQQEESMAVAREIGWERDSPETFNVTLDNIRLDRGQLTYTGLRSEGIPKDFPFLVQGLYTSDPIVIPFTYETSVIDRVLAEIKRTPTFLDRVTQVNGFNLYSLLSNTGIDEDHTESIGGRTGSYIAPQGTIDLTTGRMTFTFPLHVENSDHYTIVRVTTEPKK